MDLRIKTMPYNAIHRRLIAGNGIILPILYPHRLRNGKWKENLFISDAHQ